MDSIPSGLRETKMLQQDMIKVRIFPGTKIKEKNILYYSPIEEKADRISP